MFRRPMRATACMLITMLVLVVHPLPALAADSDGDGIDDSVDNCPTVFNPDQRDTDFDGMGDVCDSDDDNDGIPDGIDNCPLTYNPGQENFDGDALGDECDPDDDNDGIPDYDDACPFLASVADADRDGAPDGCDTHDDRFWRADGKIVQMSAGAGRRGQAIVSDGAGGSVLVWLDGNIGIEAQRLGADGSAQWSGTGVVIHLVLTGDATQRVAAIPDGTGGVIVAWDDGNVFAARVNGSGTLLWTRTLTSGTGQNFSSIASDAAGGAYVAWIDAGSAVRLQRVSATGVELFAAGGVSMAVPGVSGVMVTSDAASHAFVGFTPAFANLHVQRFTSAGAPEWGASGVSLMGAGSTSPPEAREFDLVADGSGGVFVIATFAQHVNASGTPLWGLPFQGAGYGQGPVTTPRLALDGSGGIVCTWLVNENASTSSIRSQHLDANGTTLWASLGNLIVRGTTPKSRMFGLIRDGNGGYITAWWEDRSDGPSGPIGRLRMYAQRLSALGAPQWTAGGIGVSTTEAEQDLGALTTDGAGGAFALWTEDVLGNTSGSVVAQHVLFGGLTTEYVARFTSVRDVPADEGGTVRLTLATVAAESLGLAPAPASFGVWRLVPPGAIATRLELPPAREGMPPVEPSSLLERARQDHLVVGPTLASAIGFPAGSWESVGSHLATQSSPYLFDVSTRTDSSAGGAANETYVVTTHTAVPAMYTVSVAANGHSVDNLAPAVPAPFAVTYAAPSNSLHWTTSSASDFEQFEIHRGASAGFVPGPGNFVAATTDTHFVDAPGNVYYKLAAIDRHGNSSAFALASPPSTGVDDPAPVAFALMPVRPNPATAKALVAFALPVGGDVSVEVLDIQGRLVRGLLVGRLGAGPHELQWAGENDQGQRARAGLYMVRLRYAGMTRVRNFVLLR